MCRDSAGQYYWLFSRLLTTPNWIYGNPLDMPQMVHSVYKATTKAFPVSRQKSPQIKYRNGALSMCLPSSTTQSVTEVRSVFAITLQDSFKRRRECRRVRATTSHTDATEGKCLVSMWMSFSYWPLQKTIWQLKTTTWISACGFIKALLKYETVLTSQISFQIFEERPLSRYLPVVWLGLHVNVWEA